jgi:hypothetical protein
MGECVRVEHGVQANLMLCTSDDLLWLLQRAKVRDNQDIPACRAGSFQLIDATCIEWPVEQAVVSVVYLPDTQLRHSERAVLIGRSGAFCAEHITGQVLAP